MPLVDATIPAAEREFEVQDLITGDGPLMPVILRLAWPVVIMMYLQGAYNIIDTIWVGQLLGKFALAGIATGGFVLWSIFGLTSLVSVGISAMLARRIGEGNLPEAEYVAAKGIQYALLLSIAVGATLWFLVPALFGLMGTNAEVTELGTRYLRVILLGCPLIFLSFSIQRIFQAEGDTVTPMWLMFFTLIINTILDPVLMLGLFGLPKLGIAGAALATVIAQLLMVVSGIWLLRRRLRFDTKRLLHPVLRYVPHSLPVITTGRLRLRFAHNLSMDWRLLISTLRIGLPNATSQVLFPLVYMIITRLPAAYGPQYIAALRIGHTVEGISFFLALGISIATATCVGQNLGANKPVRAARAAWIATGIVVAILFVFSVLFFAFSRQVGSVFSPDLETILASATYLEILAFSQVFMGIEMVLEGAFSGAGNTVPAMVISVPLNLARIPVAYLLAGTFGLGINGVWWSISGSSIAKGLVMAFWFSRGRWKRKKV
jgi:putative MATE family efflux protein